MNNRNSDLFVKIATNNTYTAPLVSAFTHTLIYSYTFHTIRFTKYEPQVTSYENMS